MNDDNLTVSEYIKAHPFKGPTSGPLMTYYQHTDILEIYSCCNHDCFVLPIPGHTDFAWLCDMTTRERVGMRVFGVSRNLNKWSDVMSDLVMMTQLKETTHAG